MKTLTERSISGGRKMPSKKVIIVQIPWIEELSHKLSNADERNLRLVSIQNF